MGSTGMQGGEGHDAIFRKTGHCRSPWKGDIWTRAGKRWGSHWCGYLEKVCSRLREQPERGPKSDMCLKGLRSSKEARIWSRVTAGESGRGWGQRASRGQLVVGLVATVQTWAFPHSERHRVPSNTAWGVWLREAVVYLWGHVSKRNPFYLWVCFIYL